MTEEKKKTLKPTEFLANYFALSNRRVQQLAKDGIIPYIKDKGGYFFEAPVAIQKYIFYLQDCVQKRSSSSDELEKLKLNAEIRLKEAKAEMNEIELSELKGKMHSAEDVEALFSDIAATIKGMISALPGKLAVDCANLTTAAEVSARIEKECFEILKELSEYTYDAEYFKSKVQERKGLTAYDEKDDE